MEHCSARLTSPALASKELASPVSGVKRLSPVATDLTEGPQETIVGAGSGRLDDPSLFRLSGPLAASQSSDAAGGRASLLQLPVPPSSAAGHRGHHRDASLSDDVAPGCKHRSRFAYHARGRSRSRSRSRSRERAEDLSPSSPPHPRRGLAAAPIDARAAFGSPLPLPPNFDGATTASKATRSNETVPFPRSLLTPPSLISSVDFTVTRQLGSGAFSSVVEAISHKDGGKRVALKRITGAMRSERELASSLRELVCSRFLSTACPAGASSPCCHVLRYERAWLEPASGGRAKEAMQLDDAPGVTGQHLVLQLELCEGGTVEALSKAWTAATTPQAAMPGTSPSLSCTGLPESFLWLLLSHLAKALGHLHSNGFISLDVKPSNLLIGEAAGKAVFKLGDLGLATRFCSVGGGASASDPQDLLTPHVDEYYSREDAEDLEGDSRFIAPELLLSATGKRAPPADIYSLGVTLLELAADIALPLEGQEWQDLRQGRLPPFDDRLCRSQSLKDVVRSMMAPEPRDRPTAKQLLEHPWIRDPSALFPPASKDEPLLLLFLSNRCSFSSVPSSTLVGLFDSSAERISSLEVGPFLAAPETSSAALSTGVSACNFPRKGAVLLEETAARTIGAASGLSAPPAHAFGRSMSYTASELSSDLLALQKEALTSDNDSALLPSARPRLSIRADKCGGTGRQGRAGSFPSTSLSSYSSVGDRISSAPFDSNAERLLEEDEEADDDELEDDDEGIVSAFSPGALAPVPLQPAQNDVDGEEEWVEAEENVSAPPAGGLAGGTRDGHQHYSRFLAFQKQRRPSENASGFVKRFGSFSSAAKAEATAPAPAQSRKRMARADSLEQDHIAALVSESECIAASQRLAAEATSFFSPDVKRARPRQEGELTSGLGNANQLPFNSISKILADAASKALNLSSPPLGAITFGRGDAASDDPTGMPGLSLSECSSPPTCIGKQ